MRQLSIVLVTRNDNHGEEREVRFFSCLKSLIEGARYICYELVVVDWNPPSDKPEIKKQYESIFDIIEQTGCAVKHVVISDRVHKKFVNPVSVGLFEFPAKNVGIRSSSSPFILILNQDIYVPGKIWEQIKNFTDITNPMERIFLRCTRCDVKKSIGGELLNAIFTDKDRNKIEELMYKNIFTIHSPTKSIPVSDLNENAINEFITPLIINHRDPFTNASGDFLLASRNTFDNVSGYCERTDKYYHMDSELIIRLMKKGYKQIILNGCIFHIEHKVFYDTVDPIYITKEEDYRKLDEDNPNYGLF